MPSTTDPRTRHDLSRAGHDESSVESAHGGARDRAPAVAGRPDGTADATTATSADGTGPDAQGPDAPGGSPERVLAPDGTRHAHPGLDPWLTDVDDALLRQLCTDMAVARRVDTEATALQRQGQIGLWPPLLGQEAAQVGSAHALRTDDFVFSSYREHAVAMVRGVAPADLLRVWRGVVGSGWDPYAARMAPMQVIIGAQTLHAVGYAVGLLVEQATGPGGAAAWGAAGSDGAERTPATVAYFGDGATSQGDVHEAMTFAATWSAPTVFFCQNNQWAISEPVALQSKVPLVERARGYGMPGVRVDGNDVLAVLAATRRALHRARTGGGPTLIEAVTYRMGPHTTADDPTRYRTSADVEAWRDQDPVDRLTAHLRSLGALDDAAEQAVQDTCDAVAAALRAGITATPDPSWEAVFEHVYAEPHTALDAERDVYARYLDGFTDAGDEEVRR
ncbi:pyruvate dehydrogenase (acetyl-transferring) E1 component subunit alpha [Isoptericola dokdonensis]|jgi:2-oxoisovalerate dehydrogenase E1 component alpha subunit|uniref:3-methyl-2-oxobutanoate dehydrogenase subunit alpha n=1 Tax=Isoptericola dokdonensis DS-3 TaxID=1300344 RepID=A0A168FCA7_9MICO|nr:pyruvate dehydrogenase (acetyl-transferring) E1 component subunit alpha [Isoptericola dokdonensis]ANC31336.1 3-methyl-2-oxobutanoate dehydrogenase subunit alpha [Isoptericola dokdonensis DS-3]